MGRIILSLAALLLCLGCALAGSPLQNLQVSLRGKKYEISDVTTVDDLKDKMKEASGNSKEHHVLFDGKRLTAASDLADAGVKDGAQLNMVPVLNKSKNKSKDSTNAAAAAADGVRTTLTTESKADTADAMKEYLEKANLDPEKLDDLMKEMNDGKTPDMNESLKMMNEMMSSPMFQDYMSNPEMLEQSRQMILNNPMLKNMMAGMPGMAEILEDPDAWREAMQAAANMYKNMDPEQLKNMMNQMGGMGGPPGGTGGLFDGTNNPALDELDED